MRSPQASFSTPPNRAKRGTAARETFDASERAELFAPVSRLRTQRGASTEAVRARYLKLATDAQCAEKGKETRGHGVARDLVLMLVIIDKTLDAQGDLRRRVFRGAVSVHGRVGRAAAARVRPDRRRA